MASISKVFKGFNSASRFSTPLLFCYLLFFVSMIFVVNAKTYLLLYILFGLTLFFYFKLNITDTLFNLFLFSLPFENTLRQWILEITPPLFLGVPTSGYLLYFGPTVKMALTLALFFISVPAYKKESSKLFKIVDVFLLLFLLFSAIGSFFFHPLDIITLSGFIRIWQLVAIYFVSKIFFAARSKRYYLPTFIISLLFFSGLVGSLQLISRHALGTFIELTPTFSESGYTTTDGQIQYRVSGFISHPVYFGSFLFLLIPPTIGFLLKRKFKYPQSILLICVLSLLMGVAASLGTLSRTVWITSFITLLFFFPYYKQYIKLATKFLKSKYLIFLIPALLMLCLTCYLVIIRSQSLTKLFTTNGNGSIRLELINQSLTMVSRHFLFGVGSNRFTQELIQQNFPPSLNGFIVPVHNTFFIFLSELGIPAGIAFIFFSLFNLAYYYRQKHYRLFEYGVFVGATTFLISAQFHPLFNLDPTIDIYMLLMSYLAACRRPI